MVNGLNSEKYRKTIIYLLKANNCFEEYKEEVKRQKGSSINAVFTHLYKDYIDICDFIYYSFDPEESVKGWRYWNIKAIEMYRMFSNPYFQIIDLNQKEWDD